MLARSAENLYWIGRYLERAEHLCRLLEIQVRSLIDRPVQELEFGWQRIYRLLDVIAPSASDQDASLKSEEDSMADAYSLVDDLTFKRSNTYSICACFTHSRENARQIRHQISNEMWSSLNLSYLHMRGESIERIWQDEPEQFYVDFVRDISTFFGLASATMYRDEGWDFLHLGKTVEHMQMRANILAMQAEEETHHASESLLHFAWITILNAYDAGWAYQRIHGIDIDPEEALNLLVADPNLPNSMMYAITRTDDRLRGLGEAPVSKEGDAALRLSGQLKSLISHEWPETENRYRLLLRAGTLAERLHGRIEEAWFNYPNASATRHFN